MRKKTKYLAELCGQVMSCGEDNPCGYNIRSAYRKKNEYPASIVDPQGGRC